MSVIDESGCTGYGEVGRVDSLVMPVRCYARPRTRGELRDLLRMGIPCEVVSMVAEITIVMLEGWLGVKNISVRPSENEGWSIFEA